MARWTASFAVNHGAPQSPISPLWFCLHLECVLKRTNGTILQWTRAVLTFVLPLRDINCIHLKILPYSVLHIAFQESEGWFLLLITSSFYSRAYTLHFCFLKGMDLKNRYIWQCTCQVLTSSEMYSWCNLSSKWNWNLFVVQGDTF